MLVNERLDVALAVGANGVHLRGDSFAAFRVRQCVPPGFLIGRSVHTAGEAEQSGPVDYLLAGTVWSSSSKPEGHRLLGAAGLSAIVSAANVPVLAIGGVDESRVGMLAGAGAAGAAAIALWMGGPDGCRAASLSDLVARLRRAFDAGAEGRRR